MTINRNKIEGFLLGWAIGDALGIPLVGIKHPNMIYEVLNIYPVDNYIHNDDNAYAFLEKGQYSYCTQIMLLMLNIVIKYNESSGLEVFEKFKKSMVKDFLKTNYRGVDICYQALCMKFMEDDQNAQLYSDIDKFSNFPLIFVASIFLLEDKYNFWKLQRSFINYSLSTARAQLILIIILNKLYNNNKLDWESAYKKIEKYFSKTFSIDLLKIALKCMAATDNYRDAVIKAINEYPYNANELGAIVGGIAGMQYGIKNIPKYLIRNVENADVMFHLVNEL